MAVLSLSRDGLQWHGTCTGPTGLGAWDRQNVCRAAVSASGVAMHVRLQSTYCCSVAAMVMGTEPDGPSHKSRPKQTPRKPISGHEHQMLVWPRMAGTLAQRQQRCAAPSAASHLAVTTERCIKALEQRQCARQLLCCRCEQIRCTQGA